MRATGLQLLFKESDFEQKSDEQMNKFPTLKDSKKTPLKKGWAVWTTNKVKRNKPKSSAALLKLFYST